MHVAHVKFAVVRTTNSYWNMNDESACTQNAPRACGGVCYLAVRPITAYLHMLLFLKFMVFSSCIMPLVA